MSYIQSVTELAITGIGAAHVLAFTKCAAKRFLSVELSCAVGSSVPLDEFLLSAAARVVT
jgi:hypothetical protein